MKKATYLKRLRSLDHKFLLDELTQKQYATKRTKLANQWVKSQMKEQKPKRKTVRKKRKRKRKR